MKKVISFTLTLILLASATPQFALADEHEEPPESTASVMITEVKLGGPESTDAKQFVSLFNKGETSVNIDNWRLEYAKSGFDPKDCSADEWDTSYSFDENSEIPEGEVISTLFQLTDNKPGSLRLVEDSAEGAIVHDLVGWGDESPDNVAPCSENSPALVPLYGESIQRYLDCENALPVDTDNNASDFFVSEQPSYAELGGEPLETCEEDEEEPPETTLTCEGLIISEVLPNAAGSDDGNEFIELYNPTTDFVMLDGCGLAVNSSDIYWFEDGIELEPEEYLAFYDDKTGLTLSNAAGGTVYLISQEEDGEEEFHEVTYGADLDDDVSWIWVEDEKWEQSYSPTPNAMNVRQPLKPCPEGQVRNPDTNRCNTITTDESELKPCEPDEERNPETNRCRDVESGSTLKPCNPGQERNPETNRCRKIGSTSDLKPCDPDQERNPETNRCRKVAGSSESNISNVHDIQAVNEGNPYRWWIAGGAVAAVIVYGLFEWRRDIANLLIRLKR